jgi:hypothetical protein
MILLLITIRNLTWTTYTKHFADFNEALSDFKLAQLVSFTIWSCLVERNLKSFILDHACTGAGRLSE